MKQNRITEAEKTTVSPALAKLPVSRRVWAVYPDSIRMGLAGENKPVAWFIHKHHAENYAQVLWERFYVIEEVEIHGG